MFSKSKSGTKADQGLPNDANVLGLYQYDVDNKDHWRSLASNHDSDLKLDLISSNLSSDRYYRQGQIYIWFKSHGLRLLLLAGVAATLSFFSPFQRLTGGHVVPRYLSGHATNERNPAFIIKAKQGAVATENEDCSLIGVNTLRKGGNAIDAAIAATLCIGVVNLFSSGIGGGGFMTVRIPPPKGSNSSEVWTVDFRETAPALANKTMYKDQPDLSWYGGLSVGVPGELRGLEEAHKRWGSLSWKQLVQPSINLASGWRVGKELARRIQMHDSLMLSDPVWKSIFAPNGTLLKAGDFIHRANYSRTLKAIASEGVGVFYKGPIADAMVRRLKETGGIISKDDLESYSVITQPALVGTYKGKRIYTTHAPTSGPVLLHILNILEHYDLITEGRSALNVHRFIEALKFGFAARTKISDPKYRDETTSIDEISTKAYSASIVVNMTDDKTHEPDYYNPLFDIIADHGTSHVSVVDRDEMAVAITSTVNLVFGSQVMDPITGVLFNDQMADFSTPGINNPFGLHPSPYNYPAPGKRSLSSTVATIMEYEDGRFYLAIGGSGGSKIFGAVLQVLLGIDQWNLDISQAIEFGRVHDQLYPLEVETDDVIPEEVITGLVERGHNITIYDVNRVAAVVQAVMKKDGVIYAASDSRKNGIAAGY